jgi:hypothetical protein
MHRLRICLRVADQAGRVLIVMAVPAIALLAWLPAARVPWDLVILARTVATVLRGIWAAGEPEDHRGPPAGGREAR